MIVIGEYFNGAKICPSIIEVAIDADRKVEIAKDSDRGNYAIRSINGERHKDFYVTEDVFVAMFTAMAFALENPTAFTDPA